MTGCCLGLRQVGLMAYADDLPLSSDRGCGYCADDQNMFFGHVQQFQAMRERGTHLLGCHSAVGSMRKLRAVTLVHIT